MHLDAPEMWASVEFRAIPQKRRLLDGHRIDNVAIIIRYAHIIFTIGLIYFQVFHVCKDGKQTSFLCPNGTLYHQRFLYVRCPLLV